MSRRDKVFFIILVIVTTTLVSVVTCEFYIRLKYGTKIQKTYLNSEEAIEALHSLDSLYNGS